MPIHMQFERAESPIRKITPSAYQSYANVKKLRLHRLLTEAVNIQVD